MVSFALAPRISASLAEDPLLRRRAATGAILLALVVAAFEGTVVTSAMPTITRSLAGAHLYAWVFSAFLVASTVGVMVCGKLADAFGRRPVFLSGMAIFLVGSVLCGAATSMPALIAFRVLQGFGAGALQPVAMTISADLYSLEERAKIQATFTTVWGVANLFGPLVGGAIVTHASWRWVFLVNVPFGLVGALVLAVSYRDPARKQGEQRGLHRLDGIEGALLAGLVSATALFALDRAGVLEGRTRALLGVVAIALAIGFVVQQRRSDHPLLTMTMLRDPAIRVATITSVFSGALLYTATAYVPLWLTDVRHLGALGAGTAITTLLVGWAFGSSQGVRVLMRWGMRASIGGGYLLASLGVAALALSAHFHARSELAFVALFFTGLGLGPASSTALIGSQTRAPWDHRGMMTSVIYATRSLGGALLVATLASASGDARFFTMAAMAAVCTLIALSIAPGKIAPRAD